MTKIRTLLPGLLLLTACGTHSAVQQSRHYESLGDHRNAFLVLDRARDEVLAGGGAVPEDLEKAHREAWLLHLRERAREHIFEEREDAAIADLATLEAASPDYPGIQPLRDRAQRKKAMRAVVLGDQALLRKDLRTALDYYIDAEKWVPEFKPAVDGSLRVREALDRLSVRAQEQFLEAVRKLPEFRYIEVRWHADNTVTNDPNRRDAMLLRNRAQHETAMKAIARGREYEKKDQFGAALLEYRAAQRLDRTLPEIATTIAQMEREVKAGLLVDEAQKEMRRNNFDIAREQLGQAFEMSVMSRGKISELMIEARRLEGQARYQAARDLEVLGKKSEALAAFEGLAKDWPDGLSDEKARLEGLRVDIESAQKHWNDAEAAESAGELQKALDHYLDAERFYPGWKDGKARIERLRAAIAQAGTGTGTD